MNKNQIQQGDVLLRLVQKPKGARVLKKKQPVTVALGEATGHHHTFGGQATLLELPGEHAGVWTNRAVLPDVEPLEHQEHGPVTAHSGTWQVGQVREFDWLQQMERKVAD